MSPGANPRQWGNLNEALVRSEAVGDELKTCFETAKKTGKEQRCNVVVKPPTPPR